MQDIGWLPKKRRLKRRKRWKMTYTRYLMPEALRELFNTHYRY